MLWDVLERMSWRGVKEQVMGKHERQHTKIQKGEEGNEKVRTGANLTHSPGLSVQTKVYWLLNVTLIVCSRTCSRTKSSVAWKENSMLTLPLCYINYRILNISFFLKTCICSGECRVLHMLTMYSTTELHTLQGLGFFFPPFSETRSYVFYAGL